MLIGEITVGQRFLNTVLHLLGGFLQPHCFQFSDNDMSFFHGDLGSNQQNGGKLSSTTITAINRTLSAVLAKAVKWGYIPSNPIKQAERPKLEHKEARSLDEPEARHMLELLQEEPVKWRCMITFDLFSGLRRGELPGLKWEDITVRQEQNRITFSKEKPRNPWITGQFLELIGRFELPTSSLPTGIGVFCFILYRDSSSHGSSNGLNAVGLFVISAQMIPPYPLLFQPRITGRLHAFMLSFPAIPSALL